MAEFVITEKASQAKDVRAAVGGRYGEILPAEGHLFDLLEPLDFVPAWKHWSAILLRPEGLYGTRPADGGHKAAKLRAIREALRTAKRVWLATDCDREGQLIGQEIRAFDVAEQRLEVSGAGYTAEGEFKLAGQSVEVAPALALALRLAALCNDAKLDRACATVLGDPTAAALIVAAEKAGLDRIALERDYPRTHEIPFSSETKRMVTVHRTPDGKTVAYLKGSPAAVLAASVSVLGANGVVALTDASRQRAQQSKDELAAQALHVLGPAYRELPEPHSDEDLTRALIFVGLVGMIDPLRDEARSTIDTCRKAGIRAVMISGDQQGTAAESRASSDSTRTYRARRCASFTPAN